MEIDFGNNKPILIAGPTASGKSALGITLARRYNGVVINADALQVYRQWQILILRKVSLFYSCNRQYSNHSVYTKCLLTIVMSWWRNYLIMALTMQWPESVRVFLIQSMCIIVFIICKYSMVWMCVCKCTVCKTYSLSYQWRANESSYFLLI